MHLPLVRANDMFSVNKDFMVLNKILTAFT